jgi:ATP phosphoribosyltransferase regulatory subunit
MTPPDETEVAVRIERVLHAPPDRVFRAFLEGQDSAIASGGRYDQLMAHFGFAAPSVGFSLLLRKVEPFVSRPERFAMPEVESADGGPFAERLAKADRARRAGRIARL